MATVTYTTLQGVFQNWPLSDVLDAFGTVGTHDGTTFEIVNNTGSRFDGDIFRFTGTGFTYLGTTPTGGTITSATVLDSHAGTIATITGAFGDTSLSSVWTKNFTFDALDDLLGAADTVLGSAIADVIATYGNAANPDTITAGDADDAVLAFGGASIGAILDGGAGNDVLHLYRGEA